MTAVLIAAAALAIALGCVAWGRRSGDRPDLFDGSRMSDDPDARAFDRGQ